MKASIPSVEEMERRRQAREDDRLSRAAKDLFNPINLGHWIALCHEANVPYVPAEEIARVPTQDVTMFDEKDPPATSIEFWKLVDAGMKARGENWMVRWSCCACDPVKYRLGTGQPEWHPDLAKLYIDDMRAFDIVCDYPEPTVAAYARPWMKSAILDSYPVEYRVFVSHNQIDGICNYYPQRPLPNDARTLFDIALCFQYAVRLLKAQVKPLNCPRLDKHWDTTQNLMIEGDNLEVLKLLQKSYAGKVKLIYIDPPYNTGKDFVYPDNFQDNIKNYLELTGQVVDPERRRLTVAIG